ncbi:NLRC3 [Branchiostoma lanceolatum]|uniref:NLRC3 protein n=1 Tax=Branchiostoma lanceolatum TaxID=7740 RepID=A0A8J9ZDM7_BRALA|nr:NLRC3 [Branchiostoma lanceolatum]
MDGSVAGTVRGLFHQLSLEGSPFVIQLPFLKKSDKETSEASPSAMELDPPSEDVCRQEDARRLSTSSVESVKSVNSLASSMTSSECSDVEDNSEIDSDTETEETPSGCSAVLVRRRRSSLSIESSEDDGMSDYEEDNILSVYSSVPSTTKTSVPGTPLSETDEPFVKRGATEVVKEYHAGGEKNGLSMHLTGTHTGNNSTSRNSSFVSMRTLYSMDDIGELKDKKRGGNKVMQFNRLSLDGAAGRIAPCSEEPPLKDASKYGSQDVYPELEEDINGNRPYPPALSDQTSSDRTKPNLKLNLKGLCGNTPFGKKDLMDGKLLKSPPACLDVSSEDHVPGSASVDLRSRIPRWPTSSTVTSGFSELLLTPSDLTEMDSDESDVSDCEDFFDMSHVGVFHNVVPCNGLEEFARKYFNEDSLSYKLFVDMARQSPVVQSIVEDEFLWYYICLYWRKNGRQLPAKFIQFIEFSIAEYMFSYAQTNDMSDKETYGKALERLAFVGGVGFYNLIGMEIMSIESHQLKGVTDNIEEYSFGIFKGNERSSECTGASLHVYDYCISLWISGELNILLGKLTKEEMASYHVIHHCVGTLEYTPNICSFSCGILGESAEPLLAAMAQRAAQTGSFSDAEACLIAMSESNQMETMIHLADVMFPNKVIDLTSLPTLSPMGMAALVHLINVSKFLWGLEILPADLTISDGIYGLMRRLEADPFLEKVTLRSSVDGDIDTLCRLLHLIPVLAAMRFKEDFGQCSLDECEIKIRKVDLSCNYLDNDDILRLAKVLPSLSKLEHLNLSRNCVTADGVSALTRSLAYLRHVSKIDLSSNRLGPDGGKELGVLLKVCPVVRHLDVSDNQLGDEGMSAMAENMPHVKSLRRFLVANNGMTFSGISYLSQGLLKATARLELLDVSGNDVTYEGALALAAIFPHMNHIHEVNVSDCNLGADGASALAKTFPELKSLKKVNMSRNALRDRGVVEVLQHVSELSPPIQVNLEANDIKSDMIDQIVNEISNLPLLGSLDLSHLTLRRYEAFALAYTLQRMSSLETLDLNDSFIEEANFAPIGANLKHLSLLRSLQVYNNRIGCAGAMGLASSLPFLTHLMHLNIQFNSIPESAMLAVTENVKYLPSLVFLDLGWNAVGNNGAKALAASFSSLPHLRTLLLHSAQIGDDGAVEVIQALPMLSKLEVLDLAVNKISDSSIAPLVQSLNGLLHLQSVDLSFNEFSNGGIWEMSGAVREDVCLTVLLKTPGQ